MQLAGIATIIPPDDRMKNATEIHVTVVLHACVVRALKIIRNFHRTSTPTNAVVLFHARLTEICPDIQKKTRNARQSLA